MCGIAGYSLEPDSSVDRTLAAQALLAGIAERGADAVGYAHRGAGATVTVHKQRSGATRAARRGRASRRATQVLVHVRDYTKGHPTIVANNHPIRHGSVVGIHNGIIVNDEEIFARTASSAREPEMTVDSEAIFALAEHARATRPRRSSSCAARWRRPGSTSATPARCSSPAASAGRSGSAAAGDERLLRLDAGRARGRRAHAAVDAAQARGRARGRCSRIEDGRVTRTEPLPPDRSFVEDEALPAVRAPHEGARASSASPRSRCSLAQSHPLADPHRARPEGVARGATARLSRSVPSGATVDALLAQALADEELERGPGAGCDVDHPVDLPLRQQRVVRRAARRPSRPSSAGGRAAARAPRPARPPARAAPPRPARRSRPRAAPAVERAERVPDQRLRRHRAACARRGRGPSACGRAPRRARAARPRSSSRVTKRRGTRPAARLAAFQVPKCSITVCGCTRRLRVGRELAHRRRAPEPLGAGAQLREDLLVGVALADPGLELGERLRDRCLRPQGGRRGRPMQAV